MEKMDSLAVFLAEKFRKELPNLGFETDWSEGYEIFSANGKEYAIPYKEEVLVVIKDKQTMYVYLRNERIFRRVPKEFDIKDITLIYETVTKIIGKSILLYRDNIKDGTVVSHNIII